MERERQKSTHPRLKKGKHRKKDGEHDREGRAVVIMTDRPDKEKGQLRE